MKRRAYTEKEHILVHKQNYHIVEQMVDNGMFSLQDLNDVLPSHFHINDSQTLLMRHLSPKALQLLDMSWEQLEGLGTRFIYEWHHPETLKEVVPMWQRFRQAGNPDIIGSAIQKIRVARSKPGEFEPFFTFGKLSKNLDSFFKFSFEIKDLPLGEKIVGLIDENDFLRKNFQRFALLTKQEKEVLKRLALGQRNQQIAEMLFISEHTVRTHRNNIHRKLELHNSSINHVACYIKYVEAFNLW